MTRFVEPGRPEAPHSTVWRSQAEMMDISLCAYVDCITGVDNGSLVVLGGLIPLEGPDDAIGVSS